MGAGNPEYDFVILKADGVGLTSKWSDKSSSSPHIEVDLWLTLSGLVDSRRLNNERLAIRSADRDRSRDIFSCMSFRRPFILLARANEGLEAVEDEYEAAVGGRTWKNPKCGFYYVVDLSLKLCTIWPRRKMDLFGLHCLMHRARLPFKSGWTRPQFITHCLYSISLTWWSVLLNVIIHKGLNINLV